MLKRCASPQEFLDAARPLLEADEALNNLMLGLALRLAEHPEQFPQPPFLAAVEGEGGAQLLALMTPPHRIVLASAPGDACAALRELVSHLLARGDPVPGVVGPARLAEDFADLWSRHARVEHSLSMRERVYELREVRRPQGVPGEFAQAGRQDLELVLAWWAAFHAEGVGENPGEEENRRTVLPRLEAGDLCLWQDGGQAVSLAGIARRTPHGAVIGPVYTPPDRRGRGYASALTAALSQRELDRGAQFLALFTNLDNPIPNKIYQAIGYSPRADFLVYDFQRRAGQ